MIPTPTIKLVSDPVRSSSNPSFRPIDLETLFNAHAIDTFRWSSDGGHIYFETNITGRYNIWRVPSDSGWPLQIIVSDEKTTLQDPSPDGRFLLYSQDEGGNEKPNLFLFDLQERSLSNITKTRKVGYRDMKWSPDGRKLAFAAERERPGAYPIFLLDMKTGTFEKIAGNDAGECEFIHWSPDGNKLAFTRTKNYQYTGVSVLDLETGTETVLSPIDDKSTTISSGWTHDSKKIYVTSNANDQGTDAVALLDLKAQSKFEWLTLGEWESFHCATSPTDDSYVYVRNEAGNHRIFLRRVQGDELEIPLSPGVLTWGTLGTARFSPDGRRLGLLHSSADSPPEIWVFSLGTGALGQITHSLVGGLERKNFVRPQLVIYPSYDGTPIASFLYLPANIQADSSHPAIVYPHGGPTWQHMNDWFPRIQYFVSHGFVVIAPNFRGSTGFGHTFMESLRKDCGGGDLRDLVAGVEFLKKTGYVDPQRIAIMGASWGGYLTLIALTKYPEVWAAGVAMVPLANWFTAHANEDPILQAYDEWLMGTPVTDQELWRDRSPFFFADRIRAPLLLLAGANDIRCPAEETEQMAQAARRNGVEVEVKIYENEGHGFRRRENNIDSIKRAAKFLEARLAKGKPSEAIVNIGTVTS